MALLVKTEGNCIVIELPADDVLLNTLICNLIGREFEIIERENILAYMPGISNSDVRNPVATQIIRSLGLEYYAYGNVIFTGNGNKRLSVKQLTELQVFGKLD